MPSIDDLKTSNGRKANIIPSATPLKTDEPIKNNPSIPSATPVIETPSTRRKRAVSMSTGESIEGSGRQKADLNSLPKYHDEIESGIIKEDPLDDLLGVGQGGPFDEYLKEKTKEMNEWVEEREEKADLADLDEEKSDDNEDNIRPFPDNKNKKEDEEEIEVEDRETKINNYGSYHQVDLAPIKKPTVNESMEETMQENQNYINEDDRVKNDINEDDDFFDDDDEEEGDEYISEAELAEQKGEITPPHHIEPEKEIIPIRKAEPINDGSKITKDAEEIVPESPAPMKKKSIPISKKIDTITRSYMQLPELDEDEDKDEDESSRSDDNNEKVEALKALITEKIHPIAKKLDLKHFAISKKPAVSASSMLATQSAAVAKWPLPATGVVIQVREISGPNLELIRSSMERRPADIRGALKIIFDHIVSPKPESFEVWMKTTAYTDFDHLFMAIYIASFSDANYLPIDCASKSCGKAYLTDNIPIMEMVKFKDDESEKKFWDLYNTEPTQSSGMYTTEIVPISGEVAAAFKEPSLYDVLIEPNYYNQKFMDDYSMTLNLAPYIDNFYTIDIEHQELHEVMYKKYDNNDAKTARSRIRTWNKYMNMFSADEHAIIEAFTNKINTRIDWFTYRIPETTCPNCGHVTPATDNQNASALVFLRNRLAVLATI